MTLEDIVRTWFDTKNIPYLTWHHSDESTYAYISINNQVDISFGTLPSSEEGHSMFCVITNDEIILWSCRTAFTVSPEDQNIFNVLDKLSIHIKDCQGGGQECQSLNLNTFHKIPKYRL